MSIIKKTINRSSQLANRGGAWLLACCIWLLRPWVLVRIGRLRSERLGHLVIDTEMYLCERELGLLPEKAWDFFYVPVDPCNAQVIKMYSRMMRVLDHKRVDSLWHFLYLILDRMPEGGRHIAAHSRYRTHKTCDIDALLPRTGPQLEFTEEDQRLALREVESFLPADAPFVCFHARDPAYMQHMAETTYRKLGPHDDFSYHDYRDCDVYNFIPAIEDLTRRGYYGIRMGALTNTPLDNDNPRIIDYATHYRSELLDLYLSARCHFFIASNSGLASLPLAFRKPTAYVNFIPFLIVTKDSWNREDLYIPKKLWLIKEKRFLSLREIVDSGVGLCYNARDFREKYGVEVVENTADEISAVVDEMDKRLNGDWEEDGEVEELQQRAWAIVREEGREHKWIFRFGSDFLLQNRFLVE